VKKLFTQKIVSCGMVQGTATGMGEPTDETME
jgi:hypothetical protein